jgi:hypothetical protein
MGVRARGFASSNDKRFETHKEALREVIKRKESDGRQGNLTRVVRSPYGGFIVKSMPAAFLFDLIADGMPSPITGFAVGDSTAFDD